VKINFPEMTYNVSSGTLSLCSLTMKIVIDFSFLFLYYNISVCVILGEWFEESPSVI